MQISPRWRQFRGKWQEVRLVERKAVGRILVFVWKEMGNCEGFQAEVTSSDLQIRKVTLAAVW